MNSHRLAVARRPFRGRLRFRDVGASVWLCAGLLAGSAPAAEVSLTLSGRETYVDVPVTLEIVIRDAEAYSRPVLPDIPGMSILDQVGPSVSTRMHLNGSGRVTRTQTVSFSYQLIPRREGRFEIPAIAVQADNQVYHTRATSLLAAKSETDDLLFVELKADKDTVFVGDALTLTLEIWLRPFRNRREHLDRQEMWNTIDQGNSRWGPFQEMLQSRSGSVTVRDDTRPDASGNERAYMVFEMSTTLWVDTPGRFTPDSIAIVAAYPTQVGRTRDPFGFLSSRQTRVISSRPVSARADVQPVEIKPIPEADRPPYFSGAVGRYQFTVTAKPLDVAVGDPVTLTMEVRGQGRLETLPPPPLASWPQLNQDFKIPADPVAGLVSGDTKTFTQSIRPRRADLSEIPAIPFCYFDPTAAEFVTSWSAPIPIAVKPATTISVAQIMSNSMTPSDPAITELTERSGGILANYTGMDQVLSQQAFDPGWPSVALGGVPPLLFAVCLVGRRQRERLHNDRGLARRRAARKVADRAIRAAAATTPEQVAGLLSGAVSGYVADRCNLPAGGLTREEVIEHLRRRHLAPERVAEVDAFLELLENARYSGIAATPGDDLYRRAQCCLDRLEREKF